MVTEFNVVENWPGTNPTIDNYNVGAAKTNNKK
jgi:hypothetical protein